MDLASRIQIKRALGLQCYSTVDKVEARNGLIGCSLNKLHQEWLGSNCIHFKSIHGIKFSSAIEIIVLVERAFAVLN